ncbi:MAG: hypothetical protein RB191_17495 [Terriglobia bacterium]|nr:hypothetical protein [Terriglobia bacterium]
MATLSNSYSPETFRVIHPLHDLPEEKCASEGLGPIAMTPSVRISLVILRGYLVLMSGMLLYRVLEMAGVFHALR